MQSDSRFVVNNVMTKASWYWHRLKAMSAAEILGRMRERMRHVTTRAAHRHIIKLPALKDSAEFTPKIPSREKAPELLKFKLAADAKLLLVGRWNLFGWKEVQVQLNPLNLHRDYLREIDTSLNEDSCKLNHRDLPGGADARAIWELNRFAEMVRVAMHGYVNDDPAAIRTAQQWLSEWAKQYPVGAGVNWTSPLEAGLRLINLCWFDALVQASGDAECISSQGLVSKALANGHAWYVHRFLSFGSSANNHLLGELTGLLMAVKRWPELSKIAGEAEWLWSKISECVLNQFAEDGGNREQALHYHLFAFEMALHACRAMNVTEGPVVVRLQKAAEFFVRMSHSQEPWDFGDSDDAQIVPLHREKAVAEWSAWMSGGNDGSAATLNYWLGDLPIRNPQSAIRNGDWWLAKESGMAVIERDGWKVRVDASPLGFGKMAAHGHCDALHVSIWDGEQALVIDPGTGGYYGMKEQRAELASWNAHNGPLPVKGFKTPRRMGTFLWAEPHKLPVLGCEGDSLRIMIQHEGIELSRTVRFEEGAVVIEDGISNADTFRGCWTLAPECEVQELAGAAGLMKVSRDGKSWCLSMSAVDSSAIRKTRMASRCFGRIQECQAIEFTAIHRVSFALRRVAVQSFSSDTSAQIK